ncbi:MAG: hypothetical protein PHP32_01120 [Candidatus Izemoplasmatales bacterium]|nr:hypothetical protein [Candidatus Izemoplasmatales bacterium]
MNKDNRNLFGILLIVAGVAILFRILNIWHFTLWFDGWWTFFLIIPAILSIGKQGVNTGNVILLGIGLYLFAQTNGWNLDGYLLPIMLIAFGGWILLKDKK